jgi:hypothetical protein
VEREGIRRGRHRCGSHCRGCRGMNGRPRWRLKTRVLEAGGESSWFG